MYGVNMASDFHNQQFKQTHQEARLIQRKFSNVEKNDIFQTYEEGSCEEFTIKLDYSPNAEEASLLESLHDDDFQQAEYPILQRYSSHSLQNKSCICSLDKNNLQIQEQQIDFAWDLNYGSSL